MGVQNAYNNYLKKQSTTSTNNFRQKVSNSLSGKPVNNNVTKVTNKIPVGYGVTTQQGGVAKPTNSVTTPPVTQSKSVQPNTHINTPVTTQNALQTPVTAQNTIPAQATQQTAQPTTQTPQTTAQGLVSQEQINKALDVNSETNTFDISQSEIDSLAENPKIRATAYSTNKTPQQLAKELLEEQKKQMQKDWELKQQELQLQKEQLEQSYNQSVTDADKTYQETNDKLNETRYQQQQDLAISGVNRGIQYSPQQLGLENVANINHNKNLAEASNKRNELLNNLQIQLNQALANVTLGLQNATNEYNKSLATLNSEYQKQMMNWAWDEKTTKEEREWQEKMDKQDKLWQEMMMKKEMELSKKYGRSSGYSYSGGGYNNYSSGYSSRSRNASDWQNYGGYSSNLDLSDDIDALAYEKTFSDASDDTYNALKTNLSPYSAQTRATVYKEQLDSLVEDAKKAGASSESINNLTRIRDTNLKQIFEDHSGVKNYNSDLVKRGDAKVDYYQKNIANKADRYSSKVAKNAMEMMRKKNSESKTTKTKTTKTKVKSSTSKNRTKSKVAKNLSKASSNAKKNVSNSIKNAKKNTTKSTRTKTKQNVAKSVTNAKKNVSNAKKNVKKNVSNSIKNAKKNSVSKTLSKLKRNISKSLKKLFK